MSKKIWFDKALAVKSDMSVINSGVANIGVFFEQVARQMPGLSSVALVSEKPGQVVIKTNEGVMLRSGIKVAHAADRIQIEFTEVYKAGRFTNVSSENVHLFEVTADGLLVRVTISNVHASGILGFFYTRFGSASIGTAILNSYRSYLDNRAT